MLNVLVHIYIFTGYLSEEMHSAFGTITSFCANIKCHHNIIIIIAERATFRHDKIHTNMAGEAKDEASQQMVSDQNLGDFQRDVAHRRRL